MLKDELEKLHGLTCAIDPECTDNHLQLIASFHDPETCIADECQRIRKKWTDLLYSNTKDHIIQRYVQAQQQNLLKLIDLIHHRDKSDEQHYLLLNSNVVASYSECLLEHLLELNDFLHHYFKTYVNTDCKIPEIQLPAKRKKIVDAAIEINTYLQIVELDMQLKKCISDYMAEVVVFDAGSPLTYRYFAYIMQFTRSLVKTLATEIDEDLTYRVIYTLYYLNFNNHNFCEWQQQFFALKKSTVEPKDQAALLGEWLLTVKTIPVHLEISYDSCLLPINATMENWINELKSQNDQLQLLSVPATQKLEFRLTVAQIAMLIKLFIEENVFAAKSVESVIAFFSRNFTSKNQDQISKKSMSRLYYTGEQFNAYVLKNLLLKMISRIESIYLIK